ncbi:MAG: helix-turn-helix transcriptional regulator [Salinivirgaceae bacterium]|nr:helix-turn-helix transcriptional regulator [Salinivirgaceae bacterium]
MENHLDDPGFDPLSLANELLMSRVQLYRKLKAVTNQTVNEFIFAVRVNEAAQILTTQNKTISEVAYEVGFRDPAHFSKIFSKHFGMPPSKYSSLHKKK